MRGILFICFVFLISGCGDSNVISKFEAMKENIDTLKVEHAKYVTRVAYLEAEMERLKAEAEQLRAEVDVLSSVAKEKELNIRQMFRK